ncbi:hypothetical protein [Nannocystis pusilla]|uniref:hypothetical protein n=1 Tax=Nannocystis pusilla TaxID=889268 RepID=UPI003B80E188
MIGKMVSFGNSNVLEYEFLATVVTRFVPAVLEVVQLPRPGWETYTVPPEDRPAAGTAPAPSGPCRSVLQDRSQRTGPKSQPSACRRTPGPRCGACTTRCRASAWSAATTGRSTGGSPPAASR